MVIGYKLLSKTLTNIYGKHFQYEIGKTYKTDSCQIHEGFHFCLYPEDCNHFVRGGGRLFKVAAIGEIESLDGYQYATNEIKILEEIRRD